MQLGARYRLNLDIYERAKNNAYKTQCRVEKRTDKQLVRKVRETPAPSLIKVPRYFEVDEILIHHLHVDDTKWGEGWTIRHWLANTQGMANAVDAETIERLTLRAANTIIWSHRFLRIGIRLSRWYYYNGGIPDRYRHKYFMHEFTVVGHKGKKYQIRLRLYPWLLDNQFDPQRRKGGISVNGIFQYISYTIRPAEKKPKVVFSRRGIARPPPTTYANLTLTKS
jgi:hypothetical protein